MKRITVTYAQINPASASEGDFSETGWIDETGTEMADVAEAVEFLRRNGAFEPSNMDGVGCGYSTGFSIIDYSDGTEEEESYHLEGFTEFEQRLIFNLITQQRKRA